MSTVGVLGFLGAGAGVAQDASAGTPPDPALALGLAETVLSSTAERLSEPDRFGTEAWQRFATVLHEVRRRRNPGEASRLDAIYRQLLEGVPAEDVACEPCIEARAGHRMPLLTLQRFFSMGMADATPSAAMAAVYATIATDSRRPIAQRTWAYQVLQSPAYDTVGRSAREQAARAIAAEYPRPNTLPEENGRTPESGTRLSLADRALLDHLAFTAASGPEAADPTALEYVRGRVPVWLGLTRDVEDGVAVRRPENVAWLAPGFGTHVVAPLPGARHALARLLFTTDGFCPFIAVSPEIWEDMQEDRARIREREGLPPPPGFPFTDPPAIPATTPMLAVHTYRLLAATRPPGTRRVLELAIPPATFRVMAAYHLARLCNLGEDAMDDARTIAMESHQDFDHLRRYWHDYGRDAYDTPGVRHWARHLLRLVLHREDRLLAEQLVHILVRDPATFGETLSRVLTVNRGEDWLPVYSRAARAIQRTEGAVAARLQDRLDGPDGEWLRRALYPDLPVPDRVRVLEQLIASTTIPEDNAAPQIYRALLERLGEGLVGLSVAAARPLIDTFTRFTEDMLSPAQRGHLLDATTPQYPLHLLSEDYPARVNPASWVRFVGAMLPEAFPESARLTYAAWVARDGGPDLLPRVLDMELAPWDLLPMLANARGPSAVGLTAVLPFLRAVVTGDLPPGTIPETVLDAFAAMGTPADLGYLRPLLQAEETTSGVTRWRAAAEVAALATE